MQLVELVSFKFPHIVRQDVKWTMCFVPLDIRVSSPIFASNCLKLNFKLFFLTDVSNYCEERKIKLSVNVYIKIARNLGSNFLDFWQFFSNFLAFQWATFQHFTSTIGIGLNIALAKRAFWLANKLDRFARGLHAHVSLSIGTFSRQSCRQS